LVAVLALMLVVVATGCGTGGEAKSRSSPTATAARTVQERRPAAAAARRSADSRPGIAVCTLGSDQSKTYKAGTVTLYEPNTGVSLGSPAAGVDHLTVSTPGGGTFKPYSRTGSLYGVGHSCADLSYDGSLSRISGL
jgi:hypothetical protein